MHIAITIIQAKALIKSIPLIAPVTLTQRVSAIKTISNKQSNTNQTMLNQLGNYITPNKSNCKDKDSQVENFIEVKNMEVVNYLRPLSIPSIKTIIIKQSPACSSTFERLESTYLVLLVILGSRLQHPPYCLTLIITKNRGKTELSFVSIFIHQI